MIHCHLLEIQVEIVQNAFTPSEMRIAWASRIVRAFVENSAQGSGGCSCCRLFTHLNICLVAGAFSLDGAMIDMPTVLQAHNVLRLAVVAKKLAPEELPTISLPK